MKKEYRMSKQNGTAIIFQYTIPLPNFSFSIFYFDFYFTTPPENPIAKIRIYFQTKKYNFIQDFISER